MKLNNVKVIDKGNLIAKFDIEFEEWGLTLRDCIVINGQHGKFVSLPSRPYEQEGQKKYFSLVVFTKEKKKELDEHVLLRLKPFLQAPEPSALVENAPNEPEPTDMF